MLGVFDAGDCVGRQIQDVRGHVGFRLCRELDNLTGGHKTQSPVASTPTRQTGYVKN